MTLTDENAFGFLFAYHDLEDDEYSLEPEDFVTRFTEFRSAALSCACEAPLGDDARVLDLGHAVYFELADGNQRVEPIGWLKRVREALQSRGFTVAAVVTHGGRWVDEEHPNETPPAEQLEGGYVLLSIARPSEPLRRALFADAATHGTDGEDGWGAGTYVDTEVVEALGKSLKNAPTPLAAGGATFYRIAR
jgi:hypothetical protein